MPPVSHPFKLGALIILMNYNDHAPPHVHVKYQNDVRSYRIEIRTRLWMKPGKIYMHRSGGWWKPGLKRTSLSYWSNGKMPAVADQL
jgi:hypothetical protein